MVRVLILGGDETITFGCAAALRYATVWQVTPITPTYSDTCYLSRIKNLRKTCEDISFRLGKNYRMPRLGISTLTLEDGNFGYIDIKIMKLSGLPKEIKPKGGEKKKIHQDKKKKDQTFSINKH